MGPVGPSCREVLTFATGDDRKTACATNSTDGVIVSVGSNNQWGFEQSVLRQMPGTSIHTFDCTLGGKVNREIGSGRVRGLTFHDACLGLQDVDLQPDAPSAALGGSHGVKRARQTVAQANISTSSTGRSFSRFRTWQSLLAMAGLTSAPSYVKMDIEGGEWSAVPAILAARPEFHPLQLALEVHYIRDSPSGQRLVPPGEIAAFLSHLYLAGGYMMIGRRDNPFCLHCKMPLICLLKQR